MQEFFIDSDGIQLHAKLEMPESFSQRCPLAIVQHGLTGHMEERHIIAVARAMREMGVATLRTELYGHGSSGGSFEKHTLLKWVDNMLDVIDYAKTLDFVSDLYLCGHSQGGLLAMLVAALRRDDLAAIIPMSPAIVILNSAHKGRLFESVRFDPAHVPDRLRFIKNRLTDDEVSIRFFCGDYFRIAQHIHINEAIDAYDRPVLLVHGTADEGVPVSDSVQAADRYANARLLLIEDDDHGYHQHLDKVCTGVQDFLALLR